MLAAVLYAASAGAVVDPYEAMVITPAEGEVESLQHFTITFAGLPVQVAADAIPTLQKGGGATYQGTMRADDDGTTVVIDFDQCFTTSGHYFLNLPENSLTVNGQRLLPLTLRFNITGTIDSFYEQITITPAEGEVESLQYFTISLPEYVGEITYGSMVTLTNTTTNKVYYPEMIGVGYTALVYLPDEVTEAGDYTLNIPAGSIVIYTLGEDVHELSFNYTIAGSDPTFYEQITIDPAEGIVERLKDFTITFPQNVDCLAPDCMAELTNTTTGETWPAAMGYLDNQVLVSLEQEVSQAGQYTLTIPVGTVIVEALGEEVHELNFNYTISESGMPDFTINPPEGELYFLQNFTIAYGQQVIVDEEAHPTVTNIASGDIFDCNIIEIGGNALVYLTNPLSVLGDYLLNVPAGCITIEATGQTNPEMNFLYTVVERDIYIPPVIEAQPEGEVRMYDRSGKLVREVEKSGYVPEGEWPYELVYEEQHGVLSFVFADSNKVYIQRPVSWTYYDGWVEGTLSEDGKTITVPMGQYVAYTKSLEMAVQVAVFTYDEEKDTYAYDESIKELTYTINDDGTISLNGTDQYTVLGVMNRAFGQNFQYLDYEWLQSGDYESVYLPIDEEPEMPPEGMETESYYLTTAVNDGYAWDPYRTTVNVGFEGDNMWIQGITDYLPNAWIKGVCVENTVTFANPQLLGTNDALFYFKCAEYNPVNGNTTQKDMVLTLDRFGDYKTFDYVFITVDKDNLYFVDYYQGLTLSKRPDALLKAPGDLTLEEYTFSYLTQVHPSLPPVEGSHSVMVGFKDNLVYIQGIWPNLPDAWVGGELRNGKLEMNLPQYMGRYYEEYSGNYPIYLGTFDKNNGSVLPQILFDFDPETKAFSNDNMPLSIGINKTGYLSIQDYFSLGFTPVNSSVHEVTANAEGPVEYYDLQGHRLNDISNASGIIIIKKADGTVTKVLKH